jgi:hypothetical protein
MKKIVVAIAAMLVLAIASCHVGQRAQQEPRMRSGSLLGTWELVSYKYGDQKEFSDFPKDRRRIKMITETHYIWVEFQTSTKEIQTGAGGSYSFSGDTYTESKDFAIVGMTSYLGKKHVFTVRVEGDKFYQSGALSTGFKIEEIWHRIK